MRKTIYKALAAMGHTANSFAKEHDIVSQPCLAAFLRGEKILSVKHIESIFSICGIKITNFKDIWACTFHEAISEAFNKSGLTQYAFCQANDIARPAFCLFLKTGKGFGADALARITKALGLFYSFRNK